jgi:hypothetical protein
LKGALFKDFEGCGHYLHNEQSEVFARTVREFLDDPSLPQELALPLTMRHRRPMSDEQTQGDQAIDRQGRWRLQASVSAMHRRWQMLTIRSRSQV